jgi:hypothetical protein
VSRARSRRRDSVGERRGRSARGGAGGSRGADRDGGRSVGRVTNDRKAKFVSESFSLLEDLRLFSMDYTHALAALQYDTDVCSAPKRFGSEGQLL